ncbi:AAA family ATPase [Microcoleus sp. Pol12B4]|uniref:AAA family ATPase n=1 Tax=Microcoleus sp. Pol12B4 TaxID=3055395 RepID=UPI002FD4B0B5
MFVISGYKTLETIYTGEKTVVVRGIKPPEQQVILKILNLEYPTPAEIAKFKHEYEIVKNLQIEGIVKPDSLEIQQNTYVLVMEDFGGQSLSSAIARNPIDLITFLSIAIRLSEILGELHHNHIIHKDIKPQNIIVNLEKNIIKIADFGIASKLSKQTQNISNSNLVEGTLAYISPEQTGRMNRSIDYRTDFYSLGVTFYQMLTGRLPFESEDPMELVHSHIAKQPVPPKKVKSENSIFIPPAVSDIVMKLLAKTAEDRYKSALGLKADLETCQEMLRSQGKISAFPLGRQDVSVQLQIPQKLYGREAEAAALLAAFERVISYSRSEFVIVSGYSGIGKSSLINEVQKPIVEARGYFISGKFDQFKRNIPYAALIQAFQELVRQLLTESSEKIEIWQEKILEAVGTNGQAIVDVIPEVELIIGHQASLPELEPAETQNRFNLVFQQFVNVFTRKTHPLVLLVDDLQWADVASLKLIKLLMAELDNRYLLLIGAYRDNDVSPTHPLMETLEEIKKNRATIEAIALQTLNIDHINQLIAETFNESSDRTQSLAELLLEKTGGNPFFLTQLLESLYRDDLISFDLRQGKWQWDVEQLQAIVITDNVVDLMTSKIQKLAETTQQAIKLAACIGNQFDLEVLSVVSEKSPTVIANQLWDALQEGLILPLSDDYLLPMLASASETTPTGNTKSIFYKFLHDRVQQAAYTLIPNAQKKAVHLKVGQLLLQNTTLEERGEKIFDIVNQLNIGAELIEEQSARDELAQLNLIAGRKAKAATAYEHAVRYLNAGLELLSSDSWDCQYDLTFNLYVSAVRGEYLNANFERSAMLAQTALQQVKTVLEATRLYDLKIKLYLSKNEMKLALETGIQGLARLGISVEQQIPQQVSIETLKHLPQMTDPYKIEAMRLLNTIISPAFIAEPSLVLPIITTMMAISREYGNSALAIYPYGLYGLILSGAMGDIKAGYEFGKLAMSLLDKFDAQEFKCKVYHLFSTCILPWNQPIRETFDLTQQAIQSGMETGDLDYTCYATMYSCLHLFLSGNKLEYVIEKQGKYIELIARLEQEFPLYYVRIWKQIALNLSGDSSEPCQLTGSSFDEEKLLPRLLELNNIQSLFSFYFGKAMLYYLFRNFVRSVENSALAIQYAEPVVTTMIYSDSNFYYSLALLALYPDLETSEQAETIDIVIENQQKMEKWAFHAPANYRHKYELVEAEKARVLGEPLKAMEYYDRAIQSARASGYINNEAIANELAAEFYLGMGREKVARTYLNDAHYGYICWGAQAKVTDLESRYPQLFTRSGNENISIHTTATSSSTRTIQLLDLDTVLKAAQAISSEIILEKLLEKLMELALANAGAQKGFLMLSNNNILKIEAKVELDRQVEVLQSLPVESSDNLPLTLVNYVARTKENIVLNNASNEGRFITDPYIVKYQPKSILCAAIVNQGKLIGLLYLENNLVSGAFTQNRLEIAKVLSSQSAVSIENALLYRTLEDKVKERTVQLAQANAEIIDLNQKLKAENIRMGAELDVTKQLQQMILPNQSELEAVEGLEIAGFMEPADEVGGDYYDVLQQDGKVTIGIGDVTGHGLESGVLMIMVQTAIRTLLAHRETDQIKLLQTVNQTLFDNVERMNSGKNMTLCLLEYQDNTLRLSGQHEEMILVRCSGEVERIDTMDLGFPIALEADIADFIASTEIQLNCRDVVVLYTDGITEAFNMEKAQYGIERLIEVIALNREHSAAEIKQAVVDDLRRYIGKQKVFDDITLVVIKQK